MSLHNRYRLLKHRRVLTYSKRLFLFQILQLGFPLSPAKMYFNRCGILCKAKIRLRRNEWNFKCCFKVLAVHLSIRSANGHFDLENRVCLAQFKAGCKNRLTKIVQRKLKFHILIPPWRCKILKKCFQVSDKAYLGGPIKNQVCLSALKSPLMSTYAKVTYSLLSWAFIDLVLISICFWKNN